MVECPPLPQVNSDGVHRGEIGETVSSIFLTGFRKLDYRVGHCSLG